MSTSLGIATCRQQRKVANLLVVLGSCLFDNGKKPEMSICKLVEDDGCCMSMGVLLCPQLSFGELLLA